MTTKTDDRLEALHEALTESVGALTSSDAWTAWLDTAAKFHTYSFNNQMLIYIQKPDATKVNSYKRWQELGRQVRKGEKGLGIFAPMTRRVTKEEADGSETERRALIGFRIVSVFDISQTDGEPIAEQPLPVLLDGEAPAGLWAAVEGLIQDKGYTVERGDCRGANGYTDPRAHKVMVRDDVTEAQAVKTLIHEMAHIYLDHVADMTEYALHRGIAEVEAESVAYLISKVHGLPTDTYTLPYVAAWAGKDGTDLIRKTGERVVKTARLLSNLTTAEVGLQPA